MRRFVPELTGLRLWWALAVIAGHTNASTVRGGWVILCGWLGLSGFLITNGLLAEHQEYGTFSAYNYALRRALRILPPLYAFLVGAGLMAYFFPRGTFSETFGAGLLPTLLNYYDYWLPTSYGHGAFSYMAPLWTLGVEDKYYLLMGVLWYALVKARKTDRLLFLTSAGLVVFSANRIVQALAFHDYPAVEFHFDTRLDSILAGCWAAALVHEPRFASWLSRHQLPHALAAWATAAAYVPLYLFVPTESIQDTTWGMTVGSLLTVVFLSYLYMHGSRPLSPLLAARLPVHLGEITYSAYVWHWLVVIYLTGNYVANPFLLFLAHAATTFAIAEVSFRLIEKPARRLRRRLERPLTRQVAWG